MSNEIVATEINVNQFRHFAQKGQGAREKVAFNLEMGCVK